MSSINKPFRRKPGDPCPYCAKPLSKKFFERREDKRVKAIKKSLAESDMKGRPREIDYTVIYHLRDQGLSIQKIADRIGKTRGTVQHALRLR